MFGVARSGLAPAPNELAIGPGERGAVGRKLDALDDGPSSGESRRAVRERVMLELESSSASVTFDARVEADDATAPAREEKRRSA